MLNISFAQLEYIIAVDTYRHFVTAAEKSFVTQPTLSMQIKKIEEMLDVQIFDRSKQPIEPTKIGVKIIQQARNILSEANKIKDIIAEHKGQVSGKLVLGIIPTLAPYLLPFFVGEFIQQHPEISLEIKEVMTAQIIEGLRNGTIDIGLMASPLNDKEITEEPLFYEKFDLFLNKKHDLIPKDEVELEELSVDDLWLLSEGHCFRSQSINLCGTSLDKSKNHRFKYDSGSLETLIKIVDTEGGATLIPELRSVSVEKNKKAQIKSIINPIPYREISLCYSKGFAKNSIKERLKKCLLENIPKHMLSSEKGEVIAIGCVEVS